MNVFEFMDLHPVLTVILVVFCGQFATEMVVGVARALRGPRRKPDSAAPLSWGPEGQLRVAGRPTTALRSQPKSPAD